MAYWLLAPDLSDYMKLRVEALLNQSTKDKDNWQATPNEVREAYKLQLTLPYDKVYTGGVEQYLKK